MAMMSFYYILLALAFFLISLHLLSQRKKNLPPNGPLCLPIIGHLYLFKRPLHSTLARIADQYGPILFLRLGSRPVLLVSSSSAAEECFTTNDVIFANRPRLLVGKYLGNNYSSLVWASYGHHWRALRRIATLEFFSPSRFEMFAGVRAAEVRSLVRRLFLITGGNSKVEMKKMFSELTLNVMMRTIAGKRYYGDDGDDGDVEEPEKGRRLRRIMEELFAVGGLINVGDFMPVLNSVRYFNKGLEEKLAKVQEERDKFMQELIEEHRMARSATDSAERKKTLIDVMLSLRETEPEFYTEDVIRSILEVLISAGADTTGGTMEWAMSLLLNHPEVLKKAQAEIDACVGQTRLLTESDLANLPYLHGIINETLRMHPAAGAIIPPHESSEECTIGGFTVPCRTTLLVNLWAIQYDPKLWEEPTKFKPERFEITSTGGVGKEAGCKMMPFGWGRRRCPGESLAMRVVGLALGSLIQCFDWERSGEEMVDLTEGTGITLPKAQPLEARCKPRAIMLNLLSQL
ncbi:cytochrome P450 81Q32-like [Macadamia integrifolia]|uniref:cytochrome P450 81Q32-like n=1 Tax=Macadamia integrifolia TaxID=60698 RepID=UPI001C529E74|nr:cytochrome P450 81Q32-like [Macadamia integrifolia]